MEKTRIYSSLEDRIDQLVHNRRKSFWIIFFLAALAYSNFFFNTYVLDDISYIVDWPLIRNLLNFPRFFVGFIPPGGNPDVYSPLKTFFHSLIYILSAGRPIGFHVLALAAQLFGVYAVYQITSFLTRNAFITFLTALLFALHPIHVEAITSMTGVTDTLGLVFLLFAFYHYLKAVSYEGSLIAPGYSAVKQIQKEHSSGWLDITTLRNYNRALGLAAAAVFTSELALAVPFLFFFYDYGFSHAKRSLRFSLRRTAPFLLIVLFYLWVKSMVLGNLSHGQYLENSFYLTMLLMVKAWAQYLWLLLFPFQLSIDHVIAQGLFSYNPKDFDLFAVLAQSPADPQTLVSFIVLTAAIIAGWVLAPKRPLVSFCVGWFFISLLPVSGVLPSSIYLNERYLYLGSFGFCLLASYGIYLLYAAQRLGSLTVKRSTILACVVGLLIFYSARDLGRNRDWRDSIAIYESAVKANPHSASLRNDLGIVYFQYGELDKAKDSFEKAIAMKPSEAHFYFSAEETYSNLEQYEHSIAYLRKTIELNPQFAEAYFNLAGLYAYLDQEDEARAHLQKAVAIYKQQDRILEAGQAISSIESFLHLPKNLSEQTILEALPEQLPQ